MNNHPHLLFVYGTLKTGFLNHDRLFRCPHTKFLGEAVTFDQNFRMGSKACGMGSYWAPVIYREKAPNARGSIWGELYSVSNNMMCIVDSYEGHPHIYNRQKISVIPIDGETQTIDAWCYLGHRDYHDSDDRIDYTRGTYRFLNGESVPPS